MCVLTGMDVLHAWGVDCQLGSDGKRKRGIPLKIWYTKYWTCSVDSDCPDLIIWCRSASKRLREIVLKVNTQPHTFHRLIRTSISSQLIFAIFISSPP